VLPEPGWLALNGLIVIPVAFWCLATGPKYISGPEVAMFYLLETILAPVWMWLIFSEAPTRLGLIGGAIIVTALVAHSLWQLSAHRRAAQPSRRGIRSDASAVLWTCARDWVAVRNCVLFQTDVSATVKKLFLFLLLCFIAPALASLSVRAAGSQPNSWRSADWSSSGQLPAAGDDAPAAVYVMAARTGGLKGALAVHSWIVTKPENGRYTRYDKVGWGSPIRVNSYPADGRWYSNDPKPCWRFTVMRRPG
jgi:hypothetical protein